MATASTTKTKAATKSATKANKDSQATKATTKSSSSKTTAKTKAADTSTATKSSDSETTTQDNASSSETSSRPMTVHKPNNSNSNGYSHNRRSTNNNHNRKPMKRHTFDGKVDGRTVPDAGVAAEEITGMLDMRQDGSGVLREGYKHGDRDAYISASQVRRFHLRAGDTISGPARKAKDNERFWGLLRIETVNGQPPLEAMKNRPVFNRLTPVYPNQLLKLETTPDILSTRIIDLVAPIGFGQRSIIVSPPKAGKTTILKDIATGVAINHPDVHLMAVLIGERPEEVTDIDRHIKSVTNGKGETAASNFDEPPAEQTRISELALERARRLVENGAHVVVLMDSITRLARAYNLAIPTSGRTLSGGFDPAALYPPKKFFGAARNFEIGASLTIIGTSLIDTGSRMDDLIYEEFKGTGNQELHLNRKLANRRIWPAIDVQRSGTRNDDLLFNSTDYQSIVLMHRMFDMLGENERTEVIIDRLRKTKSNKEFLATLKEG